MIIASVSLTGTIREHNQDYLRVDAKLCLAIIADGSGPNGRLAAETVASKIFTKIGEVAPVIGGNETEYRLNDAVELAIEECRQAGHTTDSVSLSAIWLNRGILAAITCGRCALAQSNDNWDLKKDSKFSQPVQPGQIIMLCSEGITRPAADKQIPAFSLNLSDTRQANENSLQTQLETFASDLAMTYDGDDRSAILLYLETADISAGEPHELELFEHFNKEYRIPLWAPIAAMVGTAASGAYAFFKLRKYLPNIGVGRK